MAPLFHMEALLPSSISPKINSILQSHIYPQVGHVFHALAKFKSLLVKVLSKKRTPSASGKYTTSYHHSRSARSSKKSKIASFVKLQFTWAASSSAQARDLDVNHVHSYYDSTWNVVVPREEEEVPGGDGEDTAECGYLCWLEEDRSDDVPVAEEGEDDDRDGDGNGNNAMNEIDRLAEKFIARCHAKFLLEKQESYRRYQDMMARSM